MPVTNYYTVDGSIIGEATGGVRTDYLTDALGSVTATVDSSGNLLNTYRYKPYGEQLAKTGVAADPKFTWVGTLGYRQTGRKHSDTYIRARHYGTTVGRWTTKDILSSTRRILLTMYDYANSSPAFFVDPTGLIACQTSPDCCTEKLKDTRGCPSGNWAKPSLPLSLIWIKSKEVDCRQLDVEISGVAQICSIAANHHFDLYEQLEKIKRQNNDNTPLQLGCRTWCCSEEGDSKDYTTPKQFKFCGIQCCADNPLLTPGAKLTPTQRLIVACLVVHENKHRQECEATRKQKRPEQQLYDEYCAYRSQLECLLRIRKLAKCAGRPPEHSPCLSAWGPSKCTERYH